MGDSELKRLLDQITVAIMASREFIHKRAETVALSINKLQTLALGEQAIALVMRAVKRTVGEGETRCNR